MAELRKGQSAPFPPAAEAALLKGNKIEAIKIVREQQVIGLREAKDMVDEYMAAHPGLRMQVESAQAAARGQLLPWLLAVIAIGVLLYYFLVRR